MAEAWRSLRKIMSKQPFESRLKLRILLQTLADLDSRSGSLSNDSRKVNRELRKKSKVPPNLNTYITFGRFLP